jgi:transposase
MDSLPAPESAVTVGVDTHLDTHLAAVIDQAGRLLDTQGFPASTRGYVALVTWAERFGAVERIGVEGTGTYGAGLTRFVRAFGLQVVEVNRPDRSPRRRQGTSDPIDAQAAARATLAGWLPPPQDPRGPGRADPGAPGGPPRRPQSPGGGRRATPRRALQRP